MNSSKKRMGFILMAVMALALASIACGTSSPTEVQPTTAVAEQPTTAVAEQPSSPGQVKVNSFKLFIDDGSGEPGDEVSTFKPSDRIQHFEVNLDSMLTSGAVVKWVFTAVDTSAGQNIAITEVETTVLLGNNLTAQLEMDQDFPTGTYRADVYVDGSLLQGFDYSVQ